MKEFIYESELIHANKGNIKSNINNNNNNFNENSNTNSNSNMSENGYFNNSSKDI